MSHAAAQPSALPFSPPLEHKEVPTENNYRFVGRMTTALNNTSAIQSLAELPQDRLAVGCLDGLIRVWDLTREAHPAPLAPQGRFNYMMDFLFQVGRSPKPQPDNRLTDVLTGHTKAVSVLLLLPDGRLASGSADNTIRLWDLASGTSEVLIGHRGPVNTLIMLPDGRLASGSSDYTIRVWDLCDKSSRMLSGHTARVTTLVIRRNGQLVSGSSDNTIRSWNVDTGSTHIEYGYHYPIMALIALPYSRLVIGSGFGPIQILDQTVGNTYDLEGHGYEVTSMTMLQDGRIVSSSLDDTIRVWDLETISCQHLINYEDRGGSTSVVTALSKSRLAAGSNTRPDNGVVYIWE